MHGGSFGAGIFGFCEKVIMEFYKFYDLALNVLFKLMKINDFLLRHLQKIINLVAQTILHVYK